MCRNGRYTERGIKERDGYLSDRYRIKPNFAVKLDPALEQLMPLGHNVLPIIGLGKGMSLLGFGPKPLAIPVEALQVADCIVQIDEGTA